MPDGIEMVPCALPLAEFQRCADTLLTKVPDLELATDIIVGFPGWCENNIGSS